MYEGFNACPDLEKYSGEPVYHTKVVEQITGIRANTLRIWERRYHFLTPKRAENDYRLYSERDVVLLRWLKERIDNGMSISEAINFFERLDKVRKQHPPKQVDAASPLHSPHVFTVAGLQAFTLPRGLEQQLRAQQDEFPEQEVSAPEPLPFPRETLPQLPEEILLLAQERLLTAFRNLDDTEAHMVLTPLLITYPVEQVCADLITPTLWKIGELWENHKITVTVEHFASNFFRGLLTNLFYMAPRPMHVPLVMISCAPGEAHELAALMLALVLRLQNVRVAYLGQSIESEGLIGSIQQLCPALVCVSLTIPSHLPDLLSLAQQIQKLPSPRPRFIFGGQAFLEYPNIAQDIPGVYIHGNMKEVVKQIQTLYTQQGIA
ncbi:hypothetical protein KSC_083850 [Ktedonobacter sp. SOSP1-52]|uniref:MerR family transcriptional regulator n=1 Tax=Ktedonobacter sp. SOSP1-52 TaxID=2778366 RepID=UPI001A335868|nr:MerR family transcriptional regulator [Ktedonobacter sp. SOSP1-52]GHO69493.1 hypothetical protein KSC_083850 [Ktedonobacter sp. SOSP1-52]